MYKIIETENEDDEEVIEIELEEYAKLLEHVHFGVPTEYDYEYKLITLTDFIKDVFRVDLRKLWKKRKIRFNI